MQDHLENIQHQQIMINLQETSEREKLLYYEMARPFTLFKPKVYRCNAMWICLYGEDKGGRHLEGVYGIGDSPDEASRAFDKAWHEKG